MLAYAQGLRRVVDGAIPNPYLASEGVSCHDDSFPRLNKQSPFSATLLRNGAAPQTATISCRRLCNSLLYAALEPR